MSLLLLLLPPTVISLLTIVDVVNAVTERDKEALKVLKKSKSHSKRCRKHHRSSTSYFSSSVSDYSRCSTYQSGELTKTDKVVDGIFGLSFISQLSSQCVTLGVFSHCLKGEGSGGGILGRVCHGLEPYIEAAK